MPARFVSAADRLEADSVPHEIPTCLNTVVLAESERDAHAVALAVIGVEEFGYARINDTYCARRSTVTI
jgi:hypothetical protein